MNRAVRLYGLDKFNEGVEAEAAYLVDGERPKLVACEGRFFVLDVITRNAPYAVYQEVRAVPASPRAINQEKT